MRLAVFSHKEVWRDPSGNPGYVTVGGFPDQMHAISELFDETEIVCLLYPGSPPPGHRSLDGPGMRVRPLPVPAGKGQLRKLLLPLWLVEERRRAFGGPRGVVTLSTLCFSATSGPWG